MELQNILSIDPGNYKSGLVFYNIPNDKILKFCKTDNETILRIIDVNKNKISLVTIEMLSSYGMAGASVFETAMWIGRFIEFIKGKLPFILIKRSTVRGYWTPKDDLLERLIRDGTVKKWPKTADNKIKILVGLKYNLKMEGTSKETNDCWQSLALAAYFSSAWKEGKITESNFNNMYTTPKKVKKEKKVKEPKK